MSKYVTGAATTARHLRKLANAARLGEKTVNALLEDGKRRTEELYGMSAGEGDEYKVYTEPYKDGEGALIAEGHSVGFLEFGTGVFYEDNHPLAKDFGAIRGGYGKGYGKQETWGYYGLPAPGAKFRRHTKKGDLYTTHGMSATKGMYEASKLMRDRIYEYVKKGTSK